MRLVCSNCNAKFIIIPKQLGISGRQVKCSKCGHTWYQRPLEIRSAEQPTSQTAHQTTTTSLATTGIRDVAAKEMKINLPVISKFKAEKQYNIGAYFRYCIIIISVSLFLVFDYLKFNNSQVTVKDIRVARNQDGKKVKIYYKIINSSSSATQMPLIRIRVLDNNNKIVKSYLSDHLHVLLQPNQHISMKTEFESVDPTAEHVDITLGNKFDFLFK